MKTIKARLIAIFTVVILIITGTVGFITITIVSNSMVEDAKDDLQVLAESEAKYIQARRDAQLMYIEGLAQNSIIQDTEISLEEKIEFLEREEERTGYDVFALTDLEGNAKVLDNSREILNVSDREYFQRSLNGEVNVSDILISRQTGQPVLIYATPIYLDGKQTGVFYGRREGILLSNISNEISYGETGYGYIVNNQGTLVGHPNIDNVLNQYNLK